MDKDAVIRMLKARQGKRSMRAFASDSGVTPAYLSQVYRGKQDPGPALLELLGLEKQTEVLVRYVKKDKRRWR